jgi:hypothetical protein
MKIQRLAKSMPGRGIAATSVDAVSLVQKNKNKKEDREDACGDPDVNRTGGYSYLVCGDLPVNR